MPWGLLAFQCPRYRGVQKLSKLRLRTLSLQKRKVQRMPVPSFPEHVMNSVSLRLKRLFLFAASRNHQKA